MIDATTEISDASFGPLFGEFKSKLFKDLVFGRDNIRVSLGRAIKRAMDESSEMLS